MPAKGAGCGMAGTLGTLVVELVLKHFYYEQLCKSQCFN